MVVGETFLSTRRLYVRIISVVAGSVVYRMAIAVALSLRIFSPSDLNLLTAALVAVAMCVPMLKEKLRKRGRDSHA